VDLVEMEAALAMVSRHFPIGGRRAVLQRGMSKTTG
jgi:hypothetical protein